MLDGWKSQARMLPIWKGVGEGREKTMLFTCKVYKVSNKAFLASVNAPILVCSVSSTLCCFHYITIKNKINKPSE